MNENWESDPYAEKWLNKMNSERTVENYKSTFVKWLEFTGKTPTQLIKERAEDLTSTDLIKRARVEDQLLEYKKFLVSQNYSAGSIKIYLTSILSFYAHNRLALQLARGDLSVESKQKTIRKWTPSNEEIRAIYHFLDSARDRAVLLLAYHSGLNTVDIVNLNIEDLDLSKLTDEQHYYIEHKREKTDILTKTCISSEAVHDILISLRQRGSPTEGALFVSRQSTTATDKEPSERRITSRLINNAIKSAVQKAHPQKVKMWKLKSLRSSYNDCLLRANLTQETKDVMIGHKRLGARSYYECSETTIRQAYDKAFKFLSINGGQQARQDLQRIEQTLTGLSELVSKQAKQLEQYDSERRQIFDLIHKIQEDMKGLWQVNQNIKKRIAEEQAKK